LRIATDAAGIFTYLVLAAILNHETSLRYAIPFVIALTPTRLLYPLNGSAEGRQYRSFVISARAVTYGIAALQLATIVIFSQLMWTRLSRIALEHTPISFPFTPELRQTEARNLGDEVRSYLRDVQAKTPVGSTIWAWVDAPAQLDFARNKVWHFHHTWFVAPWRIDGSSGAALRRELVERGVDYVCCSTPRIQSRALASCAQIFRPRTGPSTGSSMATRWHSFWRCASWHRRSISCTTTERRC